MAPHGRLLLWFDLTKQPDPIWNKLTADLCLLARLADLRTHPPGYYYVHPLTDSRDIAVPLPANPRGLPLARLDPSSDRHDTGPTGFPGR